MTTTHIPISVANAPATAPVQRTDEELYNLVAMFLAPVPPLYVSPPIAGRVYIGLYPNFGDTLSAARITGEPPRNSSEETLQLYDTVGELQQAIKGFALVGDPVIDVIRANPQDPKKWVGGLHPFNILAQRHPKFGVHLLELWRSYLQWKISVTPTEEEMEKYSRRVN